MFFNVGCNEQVFLLNPEKEFRENLSCRFREKRNNRLAPMHSIPKNDVIDPKTRLL